jgi:predicted small lipoprotein YifL
MTPSNLRVTASLLAILAATAALSACGRRGPPEAPPSAAVLSTDENGKVAKPARPADRPFVLDPLIQ